MAVTTVTVTTWPEVAVLDEFWRRVRKDVDRLELLRELSDIVLERPAGWNPLDVRQGTMATIATLTAEQCFVCYSGERRLYWHHIIQVQHGGSETPRNLVCICHRCHKLIHPWLEEPTTLENRFSWTNVQDIIPRVVKKLSARWEAWQRARSRPDDDQPF